MITASVLKGLSIIKKSSNHSVINDMKEKTEDQPWLLAFYIHAVIESSYK